MPAKVFSVEDGNLNNKTIITARERAYSDIDLSFAKKGSGDVFKKPVSYTHLTLPTRFSV